MPNPKIDDRDWSKLSRGEQIRQIEVEGFLVLPDLLDAAHVARLKEEANQLPMKAVDYSPHQKGCPGIQFHGGAITELIAHPPAISFLRDLFGEDIVMMSYAFARSEPGHPGISLHADGQPWGSKIFGFEGSCPALVRVLYYLDDLTVEVSPFRVVPRSHLALHADANPYTRYVEHPEEVMVPVKAGGAVLINHRVFHGNFPNTGTRARDLLAIAYRPGWAGPLQPVAEWDPADLEKLSPEVRALCGDRSRRQWVFDGANKPKGMASQAPGIDPSRWDRR